MATSVAQLPTVIDAYTTSDPSATLQPLAEPIREASGMTFVVLTDAHGIRYAHPDPARIGELASTDPTPTLAGEVFVGTETGTLGETLRAKVPIRGPDGRVIGAASVGILESALADDLREDVPVVVGWLGAAALVGSVGSALAGTWSTWSGPGSHSSAPGTGRPGDRRTATSGSAEAQP